MSDVGEREQGVVVLPIGCQMLVRENRVWWLYPLVVRCWRDRTVCGGSTHWLSDVGEREQGVVALPIGCQMSVRENRVWWLYPLVVRCR